jgi:predicted permease
VAFWHWSGRSRDFDDEVESHLRIAMQERIAAGEDPETARLAARREFGNVTLTAEATRLVWRGHVVERVLDIWQDVRYATRLLGRSPGHAIAVILVLALGIGTNISVFTLFSAVFLRPLPGVDRANNLAVIVGRGAPDDRIVTLSYPDYQYLRQHDRAFAGMAVMSPAPMSLGFGTNGERVWGEIVSDNYFDVLGVKTALGRALMPSDDPLSGGNPAVVISDGLWHRSFAADPAVVGRTVQINTRPFTVVGVAAHGFHGTMVGVRDDLFVPLGAMTTRDRLESTDNRWLIVMGHLSPGVKLARAKAETHALAIQLAKAEPSPEVNKRADVIPLWQSPYGAQTFVLPIVVVLGVMGGLVLLVVCSNLANLVLARGLDRRGEVAVRLALGASRIRIVRLLLLENLMLALPAAAVGLLVAGVLASLDTSQRQVASFAPSQIDISIDAWVVAFAMLVACVSTLLFGFLPALRTSRVQAGAVMKEEGTAIGRRRMRFGGTLVVIQVAMSLLLLVAAGLTMRTARAAQAADVGFDPASTVSVMLDLQLNGYGRDTGRQFYQELLDHVRAMPGVDSAGLAAFAPLRMAEGESDKISVNGYAAAPDEDMRLAFNVVSPEYFRTMRIALLAGREFGRSDIAAGEQVIVVNETMARRYWRTPQDAIGRRVRLAEDAGAERTVVGVASDIKYLTLTERPMPYFYVPLAQHPRLEMMIHVRSSAAPASLISQVRAQVRALDPHLPVIDAQTLAAQARLGTILFEGVAMGVGLFGLLAAGLAGVGLYGLTSYTVRQRAHEIGIRVALGAQRADVMWQFVRASLSLGAIGALVGTVVALAVTRLMRALLFGVSPTDPLAFGGAFALVIGITAAASLIPAWRAARVHPISTLHHH